MLDDPKSIATLAAAILSAIVAISSLLLSVTSQQKLKNIELDFQRERDVQNRDQHLEEIATQYRDPLLHAAYDLQSRIYNISEKDFLGTFYTLGSEREKEYSIENTVFLVAQLMAWSEITRQEVRFIRLKDGSDTAALRAILDNIYSLFGTDSGPSGKTLMLFAGEQRAVGELMMDNAASQTMCIGYAQFLSERPIELDRWLDPLRSDLQRLASDIEPLTLRLIPIQNKLIDLLDLLDPDAIYFPKDRRDRIKLRREDGRG